jgi:DNA-binding response OmpR family regulator
MSKTLDILVVEDDEAIATGLALNLKLAGYAPRVAEDGEIALELLAERQPALILLDINLPRKGGLEVLAELREAGNRVPVIVLSARQDEFDKVGALRLGADDYVTKPFALAELLARVDAVLRRAGNGADIATPDADPIGQFGPCEVDFDRREVRNAGQEVKLTHLEFELLAFLLANPGRVFTRERLLREVWGQNTGSPRTVDNFVGQLRSKLETDPESPQHLVTVRGSGYRFDP